MPNTRFQVNIARHSLYTFRDKIYEYKQKQSHRYDQICQSVMTRIILTTPVGGVL